MLMSVAVLLLVVGGFPLIGMPAVYRSPLMMAVGVVAVLLCLWGGWRIANNLRAQFVCGFICTFFAGAGVVVLVQYGCRAVEYALLGGVMWFGALAMACTAVVGGLFTAIFGFFVLKLMRRHLWLAALHWSLALVGMGAYADYFGEETAVAQLPSNGRVTICEVMTAEGEKIQLPFTLRVDSFSTTFYGNDSYTLYVWQGGKWEPVGHPVPEVDCLRYGDELWAKEDLRISPDFPQPYLLLPGEPVRMVMRDSRAVKDYSAALHIETTYRGRPEVRDEQVRVNSPLECKGWLMYLNSYTPMGRSTLVTLQLRRAPGRVPSLVGMVGIILCTACWCWWRREEPATLTTDEGKEVTA